MGLSAVQVREQLLSIARAMSGSILRDLAVSRLNELYQSEDCNVGKHSETLAVINPNGVRDDNVIDPLRTALLAKVATVNGDISSRTAASNTQQIVDGATAAVVESLTSEGWKTLFPGRRLLQKFSSENGLGDWPVMVVGKREIAACEDRGRSSRFGDCSRSVARWECPIWPDVTPDDRRRNRCFCIHIRLQGFPLPRRDRCAGGLRE
jgi:hypothetical protein